MKIRFMLALAAVTAGLAFVGSSSAFSVQSKQTDVVGDGQTATLSFDALRDTTAYVIGVWGSNIAPANAVVTWAVDCTFAQNDAVGQTQLTVSHNQPAVAYLWVGSPIVGTPWRGWDVCAIHVDVSLTAPEDHALAAWLVSHD